MTKIFSFFFFFFFFSFNICFAENIIFNTYEKISSVGQLRAMISAYENADKFPELELLNPGDYLSIYLIRPYGDYPGDKKNKVIVSMLGDIDNSFIVNISKRNRYDSFMFYKDTALFSVTKDTFEVISSSRFYQK